MFLAGVALVGGMTVAHTASAGEVYTAEGDSATGQQIFGNADNDLTLQLAPMGCSEQSCCAPWGCDLGCGEGCDSGCGHGGYGRESEIDFGGWIQMGYHSGVTPRGITRNDRRSFNNHPDRFNLQQGWLYGEKIADGSRGLDWDSAWTPCTALMPATLRHSVIRRAAGTTVAP